MTYSAFISYCKGCRRGTLAHLGRCRGIGVPARGRIAQAEDLLRKSVSVAEDQPPRTLAPNMVELAALLCGIGGLNRVRPRSVKPAPMMTGTYPDETGRMAWLDLTPGRCLLTEGRSCGCGTFREASASEDCRGWAVGDLSPLRDQLAGEV